MKYCLILLFCFINLTNVQSQVKFSIYAATGVNYFNVVDKDPEYDFMNKYNPGNTFHAGLAINKKSRYKTFKFGSGLNFSSDGTKSDNPESIGFTKENIYSINLRL